MKLILFLHFHVLDDSLMQGFPSWPIVTCDTVCGSICNLSFCPQDFLVGNRHTCQTCHCLLTSHLPCLRQIRNITYSAEKLGSFPWRKTHDICHVAFHLVWITNRLFWGGRGKGAFKKVMKGIFCILLLKCPLVDTCISFDPSTELSVIT